MGPTEHLASIRHRNQKRMMQVLAITISLMLLEIIAAYMSKSLALLAEAGHMLTDVGAISLGLIAFWFASKSATPEKTYGYYRSEILAGLINAMTLLAVSIFIISHAWQRLREPVVIEPLPVLCVAVVGLIVNLVCLRLLGHGHVSEREKSLNVKAAYLEVFSDALISTGVIVSSLIIVVFHWYQIDALISLAIGLFIWPRTWTLISECTNILMEGTPNHIDLKLLRSAILEAEGVIDIHDVHVWTITSGLDAMSAHLSVNKVADPDQVLDTVTKILQEKFDLQHTTIQIEQASCQTDACS